MEYYAGAVADLISNKDSTENVHETLTFKQKRKKSKLKKEKLELKSIHDATKDVDGNLTANSEKDQNIVENGRPESELDNSSTTKKRKKKRSNKNKKQKELNQSEICNEQNYNEAKISSETFVQTEDSTERESRTVFVGNLPVTVKKLKLKKWFSKYGQIDTVRLRSAPLADMREPRKVATIKKHFHPKRTNIHAYIRYASIESAMKALEANGVLFSENHHIRVDIANNKQPYDPKKGVFVGNVPFGLEEEELRRIFDACGVIDNVRIIRDPITGVNKGIAYVDFKLEDSIELALNLDGYEVQTRELRVKRISNKVKSKRHASIANNKKAVMPKAVAKETKGTVAMKKPSNKEKIGVKTSLKKKMKKIRGLKKKEALKTFLTQDKASKNESRIISF